MSGEHVHQTGHIHEAPEFNRAFLVAIIANGVFVLIQIVFSQLANSTSLLADAIHNLGDILALVLAWGANHLLKKIPTDRRTFGMKKTSILASLANGVLLIFTCGIITTEAIYKFFETTEVHALVVILVASIGIIINGSTAVLFLKGQKDLNIRSAYLHLMYDALISFGVVLAAILMYWTGWMWLDPLMGLLIAGIILKGTWGLLSDSFSLIIDGVPRDISIASVRDLLKSQAGVTDVHDLHVWALSTQENALSVHLRMPRTPLTDEGREFIGMELRRRYNIHHITIQVEQTDGHCEDACKAYL